eukprot:295530-Rhodomonas_salina.3
MSGTDWRSVTPGVRNDLVDLHDPGTGLCLDEQRRDRNQSGVQSPAWNGTPPLEHDGCRADSLRVAL